MARQLEEEFEEEFEHIESSLDDLSHAEYLMLYRESGENLLFAKRQQWATLAYLSMAYVGIYLIAKANPYDPKFLNYLTACSFILTVFAISIEIFLQFWQINEKRKIREIANGLSNSSQRIRSLKSRGESDVHRYIMLFMLMAYILMAEIAMLRALWNMTN